MATTLPKSVQKALGGAESTFEAECINRFRLLHLPEPQTQALLIAGRKYRFDIVFGEPWKVVVECQGGVHSSGRHVRGAGYEADATKLALAQIEGYLVVYITPGMLHSGVGGFLVLEAMKARGWQRR